MSVFSKLKDWLTGKSSKSSKSTTSSKSTRKSVKRASTVSNYGGGGSRSVRDSYGTSVSRARQNREDEEKRRRQELVRKQQSTTEKLSQISKRTDALSSGKPSTTSSVTGMQTSGSGRSRAVAKLAEMSKNATPDPKKAQREKSSKDATKMLASIDDKARNAEKKLNNLDDKVRNKVEQDRKEFNKATGNRYNVEKNGLKARQAQKSQAYDAEAEKYEIKKNPVAASAARGALSGATFGASELLAKTSKNRKESGVEEFYQKNKNKTAENLGEIAGSLASFGGTAALTDKAAAKAVSKLAPRAAEELAGTKLIQKAAVRSATKAAEKGAVKGVSAELIEQIGKNKASKVVNALGNDIVQNLTTGAIYDINKASAEHEVGSPEWWKELGTSAAFNTIVTGGVAAGSIFGGGRRAVGEAIGSLAEKRTAERAARDAVFDRADETSRAIRNDSKIDIRKLADERRLERDSRRAFVNRANEANEAAGRDFLLLNDRARVSTTDPTATDVNIRQMAGATNTIRNAKRQSTLDNLLRNAERNAAPVSGSRNIDAFSPAVDATRLANANRIRALNEELDGLQREIILRRKAAGADPRLNEQLNELTDRFDNLLRERNALENPQPVNDAVETAARDTRQDLLNRRTELQEEWNRFERGETKLTPYQIEELGDELDEVEAQLKNLDETRTEAPQPEAPRTEEPSAAPINNVETEQPRAETPEATAEAPKPEAPRSREELIKLARESQTQKESEDLMKAYFDEYGEVDLGMYGQVTKNNDGSYKLTIDGVGEKTLTKSEVEKRIKESTKRAYEKPREVESIRDVVHTEKERADFRTRLKKTLRNFHTQLVDSLKPFEDLERKVAKAEGRNPNYGAINKARTYQGPANRSIGNRQLDRFGNQYKGTVKRIGADGVEYEIENGKSLVDIYKFFNGDKDLEGDFDLYLQCRHAPDRFLQGKEIFENIVDKNGRNFSDPKVCQEEADRLLKEHPEFAEKAEEVYQYIQNELKNRVDAGLLKQSVVDEWNEMYPHYVPTYRDGFFNEVHGLGPEVGAEDLKGATGSSRNIMSIRDQLAASTTRNWRDVSLNDLLKHSFGDRIAAELAQEADGGLGTVLENSISLEQKNNGRYYATVFDADGTKHTVEIDEQYYDGLKDLYKNGRLGVAVADTINEGFSKYNNAFKKLITQWSPIFMLKNPMRDIPEAFLNTKQTKEFVQCMGAAARDYAKGGPFSEALRDSGVSQSMLINLDKATSQSADGSKNIFKTAMDKISAGNEMMEMLPRLTEYMATLKKHGVDIDAIMKKPELLRNVSMELRDMAAANAADVTVNFGRSGSVGKFINKGFVPFFNPSMQGWSKFVRNFTEMKGAKDWLGFAAKATALGVAPLAISNFLYQDNPNYQMISARDKANNYIIAIPPFSDDTNMFIKIPRSRFASVLGLPMVNAGNENKMGWAEFIKVANDQVGPLDPIENNIFAPFLLAQKNETWYGSPIVPKALEDLPKSEQYDANTSWFGKMAGKATENLPKELQLSPKKVDYILDAETGVIGDFALPATTPSRQGGKNVFGETNSPVLNAVGKGLGKVGPAMSSVPKRAFTIDANTQNDLSSRFYDKLNEANTNSQSARGTEEDKEEYKRLSAYSTEASSISKAITYLQNSDRATKQDDIYGLQKVRNQLMQDAIDGKPVPSQAKTLDAVQKYVGTSYAVENFGSSADKEAMKVYGASKYGNLSEKEMQKAIDSDKDFYKGVQAIGNLDDKMTSSGVKSSSALSKAVALASVDADDDLFNAYDTTIKGRTETASKMDRARTYLADGGSSDEFVKLEKCRTSAGKLSDKDKDAELEDLDARYARGEISDDEYHKKQDELSYNANISYLGLATSLAQANAPARGYQLYDIKTKNVQKGINLAAMGFTSRDVRDMKTSADSDGNGYLKKQEIIDYVANSGAKDKATLYDALYSYQSKYNPFGRPTNYSRDDAAEVGRKNGVESISDETGELKLKPDAKSSSGYYRRGYRRRRWHRWHRGGGGSSGKATVPKPKAIKESAFIKGEALTSKKSSSSKKVTPPKLKRVERKIDLPTVRK